MLHLTTVETVLPSRLECLGVISPMLATPSQSLVLTTTTVRLSNAHASLVSVGVLLKTNVSWFPLVVLPTTHVVTVSLSSLELHGVLPLTLVTSSQAFVPTTTTVRLNNALVPLVNHSVQQPTHVSPSHHVVLPSAPVDHVCLSNLEPLGVLPLTLVTTSHLLVLTTTTVRLNSVLVLLVRPGVPLQTVVSLSHHVVQPTTDVVLVSLSSQEPLGVQLPTLVLLSQLLVPTTTTVRPFNASVDPTRHSAQTPTPVSPSLSVV